MISKESNTKDWNNDAENSALHRRNKLNFKIYIQTKLTFQAAITFHNITDFLFLWNIVSIRDLF